MKVEDLQNDMALLTKGLQEQENINHEQIAEQQMLHTQLEQYKFALHSAELEIARSQVRKRCDMMRADSEWCEGGLVFFVVVIAA